jgi:pimeloyl-ACP methyl ester carboxylesterase
MKKNYLFKLLLSVALLIGGCGCVMAQDGKAKAEELFRFLMDGKGDSVHVRLTEDIRSKIAPAVFSETPKQLEAQFGSFQSKGPWGTSTNGDMTVYYCDVRFERSALRFFTVFNKDGRANTVRFVPATPAAKSTTDNLLNNDKMAESSFELISGKYKLPAVLTLPKGAKKVPVVILVHGSGPNDRDESIGPNKPFRELAHELALRGVAVVRWVRGHASVDSTKVYILGHSLGATLAPLIAQQAHNRLAGVIMLSAAARPMEDLIWEQVTYLSTLPGNNQYGADKLQQLKKQVDNVKVAGSRKFNVELGGPMNASESYWVFAHNYNPLKTVAKLRLRMLLLQGERDYQVTMNDFSLWKSALQKRRNVFLKSYPELNHLYQRGVGKSTPGEYMKPDSIPA